MWTMLLMFGLVGDAHADEMDCVTTDMEWRYVTTGGERDAPTGWKWIHDGEILAEHPADDEAMLETTWHPDTKVAYNSDRAKVALYAMDVTVTHTDGEPVDEGLSSEVELEMRCHVKLDGKRGERANRAEPGARGERATPATPAAKGKRTTPAAPAPEPDEDTQPDEETEADEE